MGTDERGLGRLEPVDPHSVWGHEARDLTPWLLQHLDLLGDALGIGIEPIEREKRVGSFSLDILGRADDERYVIVENQLEPTNHGHLGQLLVYASGLDAAVVIWLTPSFRDEHRAALDWLNERTNDKVQFFGVELGVVRIDGSAPAPTFRVVAQPNDWQNAINRPDGITATAQARHEFFEQLFDEMIRQRVTFRKPKVGYANWAAMGTSRFGHYTIVFTHGQQLRAEVYISSGDRELNKLLFDELVDDKDQLEAAFGEPLAWERLDDKLASRIAVYAPAPELDQAEEVSQAQRWAATRLFKLMDLFDERMGTRMNELVAEGNGGLLAETELSA